MRKMQIKTLMRSRHSRLQRQVLSLYRELLRGAEARVRAEFRQHAGLPRSDVLRIEYLYRRGWHQLQMLRSGHATAMGAFVRTRGPTEESTGAGAPGTLSDEGDDPKRPLDSVRTQKTPLDGR
nr:succinate dehydrogenase assembly factor 1, mitochondrial-like [Odocoileus virginianus texanus]